MVLRLQRLELYRRGPQLFQNMDSALTNACTNLPSSSRVQELDGIRGTAILMVFGVHFGVPACVPGMLQNALNFGWAGVDLFFVLSGLLITKILLDSKREPCYFRRFYLRRALRILPIYFAFLILLFHVAPIIVHATSRGFSFMYGRSEEPWYWLYLANWRDATKQCTHIRHFWSLAIEEQFYLVWPFLVYWIEERSLKYVCLAPLVLCPLLRMIALQEGVSKFLLYRATAFRLEGLAMGALIALAMRNPELLSTVKRGMSIAWPIAAAGLALAIARSGTDSLTWDMEAYGYTTVAVLSFSLVLRGVQHSGSDDLLSRCLRKSWLRAFGKYSYGLYVWHALFVTGVVHAVISKIGPSYALLPLALIFGIGTSFLIAWISWRTMEAPCAFLKDYLSRSVARLNPEAKDSRLPVVLES